MTISDCRDCPCGHFDLSGPCCVMTSWLQKSRHKLPSLHSAFLKKKIPCPERFSSLFHIQICCNFSKKILPTCQRMVTRSLRWWRWMMKTGFNGAGGVSYMYLCRQGWYSPSLLLDHPHCHRYRSSLNNRDDGNSRQSRPWQRSSRWWHRQRGLYGWYNMYLYGWYNMYLYDWYNMYWPSWLCSRPQL